MSLPTLNDVKINYSNYNCTSNKKLISIFFDMPFYHQLGSGTPGDYLSQLESILQTKHLYCDKILKAKNIPAQDNTHCSDKKVRRDEYVYLNLGTVVKPKSTKHITIEIPHNVIPTHYDHTFFCNDPMAYDAQAYLTQKFTPLDWDNWKKSITTLEDGVKVMAGFVERHFSTTNADYIETTSLGNINSIHSHFLLKNVEFVPEFATKESLPITDSNIKFHLVNHNSDEINRIAASIKSTGYNPHQLISHSNTNDFINYLKVTSKL